MGPPWTKRSYPAIIIVTYAYLERWVQFCLVLNSFRIGLAINYHQQRGQEDEGWGGGDSRWYVQYYDIILLTNTYDIKNRVGIGKRAVFPWNNTEIVR